MIYPPPVLCLCRVLPWLVLKIFCLRLQRGLYSDACNFAPVCSEESSLSKDV